MVKLNEYHDRAPQYSLLALLFGLNTCFIFYEITTTLQIAAIWMLLSNQHFYCFTKITEYLWFLLCIFVCPINDTISTVCCAFPPSYLIREPNFRLCIFDYSRLCHSSADHFTYTAHTHIENLNQTTGEAGHCTDCPPTLHVWTQRVPHFPDKYKSFMINHIQTILHISPKHSLIFY